MHKKHELITVVKCCEERFRRGPAADWKHSDFGDLSRDILVDTGVAISLNTLKRIFGKIAVDDDYLPQQATLEALKKYGQYVSIINDVPADSPNELVVRVPSKYFRYYLLVAVVAAVIITIGSRFFFNNTDKQDNLSGSITISKIEGVLPATIYFNLDLPSSNDSLFVNFGDKSPLTYVKPGQKSIAHIYLFPGVFKVTLQKAQKVIASSKVSIRTNGWMALGYRRQRELPERYYAFPASKTGKDSLFQITNEDLFRVGLDTNASYFTRLSNFTPVKTTSDNFIFEAIFKNQVPDKGIYCHSTQFQISGINNIIRFKFVSSGCGIRVNNVVSEQVYHGTKMSLPQFVINLNQWNSVKLVNRENHIVLFVNGKEVFNGTYQNSLGEIQGVFLEFERNGSVRNCELKSLDGKLLYQF